MLRLLYFLKKFQYPILFIIFEIIGLYLLISHHQYQKTIIFNSFQEVNGAVNKRYSNIGRYFQLRKVNDSLIMENARLRAEIYKTYKKVIPDSQYVDTVTNLTYQLTPAYVVNNTLEKRNNFMTIDIGSKKGINERMGVITNMGIAGIVRNVSPNFSLVISLLSSDFMVNAKIAEIGEIGSITWDGRLSDRMILKDIPSHIRIKRGMHVVVGPYSNFFPENTPIGLIESYEMASSGSFHQIYVKLHEDVRNITHVYVVEKMNVVEQYELEKNVIE